MPPALPGGIALPGTRASRSRQPARSLRLRLARNTAGSAMSTAVARGPRGTGNLPQTTSP